MGDKFFLLFEGQDKQDTRTVPCFALISETLEQKLKSIEGWALPPVTGVCLSGFMHHMHLFLSGVKKNQWEPCSSGNHYIQLSERSVESLLNSASLTLKELEIPREKLLPDTLQLIKLGAYGSIYRAQLETGSSGKTKTVVLKALQGKACGQDPLWYSLCSPDMVLGRALPSRTSYVPYSKSKLFL